MPKIESKKEPTKRVSTWLLDPIYFSLSSTRLFTRHLHAS